MIRDHFEVLYTHNCIFDILGIFGPKQYLGNNIPNNFKGVIINDP